MGKEDCMNVWGLPKEEDDSFDPDTATKCQTARKIARSYLRWAQMNICLDELQSANRKKAVIERKLENVINFMWAHQLCEDETP
ncbi:unnamed protein product [Oikopleura dioica]|uniref:Uncharacterized protein n=1 Tax=Oikopleura dioica TaxID=34765 RepID=E4YMU0_OIKDI|nr:unnamed protein product [Oikopleura dioica]